MKDIININFQTGSEDIVMEKNESSDSFQYVMSKTEDIVLPVITERVSIDCKNDFGDLREMIQSAKNMSGGIHNVIDEVSKINNNGPTDTICGISCSIVFTPKEEKSKTPKWRPTSYIPLPFINKPKLIEPESLDFKCSRELKKFCKSLSIISLYKDNLLHFLRAMFQGGGVNNDHKRFKYKKIIVLLEGTYIEELNMTLPFGSWYNNETLEYGYDIISLCIYFHQRDFSTVLSMLSEVAEEHFKRLKINDTTKSPRNIQVKNPVGRIELRRLHIKGAKKIHSSYYSTTYGVHFKVAEYWKLSNGEIESVYYTIWRPWNSQIYHCQSLYPQPPYSLYKLDFIHKYTEAGIIFVDNEMVADHNQENTDPSQYVYTTCFGGLKNLLEANLSYLSDRDLHLYYDSKTEAIQHIPEAIKRLQAHGVRDIKISFDNGDSDITSDEFMKEPEKYGYLPTKLELNRYISPITQIGETLPGSDRRRMNLIQPIIKEGYIVWLYADSKIGKTWLALLIAYIASRGSSTFGNWACNEPVGVLYIDIESLPDEFVNCCTMVMKGQGDQSDTIPFRIFSAKAQPEGEIDIMSEDCQGLIESELNGINMIIIDNFYSATDNQPSSIKPVLRWLSKLTQKGIAVIVVDHTNKEGELQGSISKERAANLSIKLEQHPDYEDQIIVSYPVARSLPQKDAKPFTLRKVFTEDSFKFELVEDHKLAELLIPDKIKNFAKVMFLKTNKSMTYEQIAEETGLSRSAVGKYVKNDIPALSGQDKKLYEVELSKLIAVYETRNGIPEDSEQ